MSAETVSEKVEIAADEVWRATQRLKGIAARDPNELEHYVQVLLETQQELFGIIRKLQAKRKAA